MPPGVCVVVELQHLAVKTLVAGGEFPQERVFSRQDLLLLGPLHLLGSFQRVT